jgi:F-type H+-transporting ATPase subunit epsilon
VLNNHAPLVSTLEKGRIKIITPEGKEIFFEILSGFIEVKDNQISVLVTV